MKTFVINLDSKPERWNITSDRFKAVGLKVERWSAVCQENRKAELDPLIHPIQGSFCTPAVLNTALSHITLWNTLMQDDEEEYYFICEDDARPVLDLQEKVTRLMDQVPENWDVLLLGKHDLGDAFDKISDVFIRAQRPIKREQTNINDYVEIPSSFSGLYGYMVSKKGATKLCEFMKESKIRMHIDIQVNMIPGLNLYASRQSLVDHDFSLGSSIACSRPSFVTKPLNGFRTGAAPLSWTLTQPIFALGGVPVNSLSIGYLVFGLVLSLCTLKMEVVVRFRFHGSLIFILLLMLLFDSLYCQRDMYQDFSATLLDTAFFSMGMGLPLISTCGDFKSVNLE